MTADDTITTPRLRLLRFDGSEAAFLHALDNDPEVMRWINGGAPTPMAFIEATSLPLFCRRDWSIPGTGFWKLLAADAAEPLGWCVLRAADCATDRASLGYRLCRTAWGKGYATEASRALLDLAFNDLDLARVTATTYEDNARSRRVLEGLGFRLLRSYREDLAEQTTALFDGTEAFPGFDLEFELLREQWLARTQAP